MASCRSQIILLSPFFYFLAPYPLSFPSFSFQRLRLVLLSVHRVIPFYINTPAMPEEPLNSLQHKDDYIPKRPVVGVRVLVKCEAPFHLVCSIANVDV